MTRTTVRYAILALTTWAGIATAASGGMDLTSVLADPARPEADRSRDADRKPAELIAFSGVKKGSTIAELAPGGGYFTRILTGAVGPKGHVYAMVGRPSPVLADFATTHPNLTVVAIQPGEVKVPAPVDVVWTTLNYHDFKNNKVGETDVATLTNSAAFKALKPGGIYFIVDHEAAAGAGTTVTSTLHRIESAAVKKEVEAAGFKLEAQSQLLAHAGDDHSQKVQETGIRGKTDQFILRFRKPKR
ncbi:class I SAM-dependent methyltransferase [soil metagenome]